jgi:hypothetical protein
MTVKRQDLDTVRIVCTRQARQRYHVCGAAATALCDYPDADGADPSGTCSRPCCKRHARYWTRGKDVCQKHAKQLGCW